MCFPANIMWRARLTLPWDKKTECEILWGYEAKAEAEAFVNSGSWSQSFEFLKPRRWSWSFDLKCFGFVKQNPKQLCTHVCCKHNIRTVTLYPTNNIMNACKSGVIVTAKPNGKDFSLDYFIAIVFVEFLNVYICRSDQTFVINNVPSGSYIVEVANPTYAFEPARVDINSKGTAALDISHSVIILWTSWPNDHDP